MILLLKSSWHYRLVVRVFGSDDIPQRLCPYFWTVVSALIKDGAKHLEEQ